MNMHALLEWIIKRQRERGDFGRLLLYGELDRVAHEVGLSAHEVGQLVELGHDPEQLFRMLKALGISEVTQGQPEVFRDMQRLCGICTATDTCKHALEAGTAATGYGEFCPNAQTFNELRAENGNLSAR